MVVVDRQLIEYVSRTLRELEQRLAMNARGASPNDTRFRKESDRIDLPSERFEAQASQLTRDRARFAFGNGRDKRQRQVQVVDIGAAAMLDALSQVGRQRGQR